MAEEANRQFKALISGAPSEVLTALGEALLQLRKQRAGEPVDSAAALRQGALELTRWLVRQHSADLAPQQRLFLYSGALADSITVKDEQGQPVTLELLPPELYAHLLASAAPASATPDGVALSLLYPETRWLWLASGELHPFDMARPGRFHPHLPGQPRLIPTLPAASAGGKAPKDEGFVTYGPDLARLQAALTEQRELAQRAQQELARGLRQLAEAMRGERLASVLKELSQFSQFTAAASDQLADLVHAASVALPHQAEAHPALMVVKELHHELDLALDGLLVTQRKLLDSLARQQQLARLLSAAAITAVSASSPAAAAPPAEGFTAVQLKKLEADHAALTQMMTQCLINHPQRTAWSGTRVLLHEQLEKLDAAPEECLATPPALLASLERMRELHPDCFPQDNTGALVLPPVVVEPGVGVVRWVDDRFLLSFVAADSPRKGPQLSFSPLDQAVLRIFGGYLARGDIFNYRGERLSDNFMAEYAGEVEQRVAVKFTGADKKMTYGTAAEEKDGANREDAVRDYMDFIFAVFNGLTLPKRVSPRKAGVLLKYCLLRDAAFTTALALHHVAAAEPMAARVIILHHTRHDAAQVVSLTRQALEASPVLQTRYRRDLGALLLAVFGHEFVDDARAAGLLDADGASATAAGPGSATGADGTAAPDAADAAAGRNYFDL